MSLLIDEQVEISTYTTPLQPQGQITIPRPFREEMLLNTGDPITFMKIGEAMILTNKQSRLPELVDRMIQKMEAEGLTLSDMLAGLEEERLTLWKEKQGSDKSTQNNRSFSEQNL